MQRFLHIFVPKNLPELLLLILCGLHLFANLLWLSLNSAPLPWDQAGHTLIALHHSYFFNSLTSQNLLSFLTISPYYPPFIHALVAVPILLLGHPVFISSLLITTIFISSIVLLYIYTRDVFQNSTLGLLTATIYSFSPIIVEHSRWFLLEIPLITFILFGLVCLNRWRKTKRTAYWYGFILALALALLTKWLAAIYFLPLIVLFVYETYRLLRKRELKSISLLIGGALFSLLILPWYLANMSFILNETQSTILPEASDPQSLFSGANFFFYTYQLITFQGTIFFAVLAVIGAELLWSSKHSQRFFILLYIVFIYIVFTIVPNKDPRYTMPILIFTSILIAYVLTKLLEKARIIGLVVTALFLGYIITLYGFLSFRPQSLHYQKALQLPIVGWIDYININDNSAHTYNNNTWPQISIHQAVADDAKGKEVTVLMLVDQERLNLGNMLIARETGNFWNILTLPAPATLPKTEQAAKSLMQTYDYVIVAEKNIGVSATRNIDVLTFLTDFVRLHNIDWFQKIARFQTPNNDTITVYKTYL